MKHKSRRHIFPDFNLDTNLYNRHQLFLIDFSSFFWLSLVKFLLCSHFIILFVCRKFNKIINKDAIHEGKGAY